MLGWEKGFVIYKTYLIASCIINKFNIIKGAALYANKSFSKLRFISIKTKNYLFLGINAVPDVFLGTNAVPDAEQYLFPSDTL